MKKILIHTLFYQNYNYGGILQAYALYHQLEKMGYQCEELNYTQVISNPWMKLIYRGFRIIEILKEPDYYMQKKKSAAQDKLLFEEYVRYAAEDLLKQVFEEFMQKEFRSTSVFDASTIKNMENEYDFYIVGGDQVWNPEWTDKNFFGNFIKGCKKISYSCSAGKSTFTNDDREKLLKYIKKCDVVSVRESNLSELLKEAHVKHQIIADPVFLLSKQEWAEFANDKYHIKDEYLFAYILGNDEERRKQIRIFADNNNLKVVAISHVFRKYCEADVGFADIEIRDAGPREFIELIKNAKFVLTDSFHGTAFSLLFEKQFLNFSRFKADDKRDLNARLKSVVTEYELDNRMIHVTDLAKIKINELSKIDYSEKIKITIQKREKAIQYLKENLQ